MAITRRSRSGGVKPWERKIVVLIKTNAVKTALISIRDNKRSIQAQTLQILRNIIIAEKAGNILSFGVLRASRKNRNQALSRTGKSVPFNPAKCYIHSSKQQEGKNIVRLSLHTESVFPDSIRLCMEILA
jgi:hypothetical protein